jgi:dipeptidyl aminopeptidase/acylaminoacyl peptidase
MDTLFKTIMTVIRIAHRFLAEALLLLCITTGLLVCNAPHSPKSPHSSITSSNIPPVPDSLIQKLAGYQNWRGAALVDWSPAENGILVVRRAQETGQIYRVDKPGGAFYQLTDLRESVLNVSVCPDAKRQCALFLQDSGGNENFQIHALDLGSLRITRLTSDSAQNDGAVWSNTGDRFVYSSNRRNNRDFDLYLHRIGGSAADSLILSKGGIWSAHDWSPDDRMILVSEYTSRTASRLFILDPRDGGVRPLTATTDTVSEELGAWSAAGKGVFFTSDNATDFRCLRYKNLSSGDERLLTASIPWDVREFSLSKDRTLIAFATNEHGFSRLYFMDASTFSYRPVPDLPRGIISNLAFDSSSVLAMTVNTHDHPEDVYTVDTRTFLISRWTKSETGRIDSAAEAVPEIIHYPTFDSVKGKPRLIPCIIYKPSRGKTPYPVCVMIHGGPESQFWPSFKPEVRFYTQELGIAVLAPNVRGSGGYGKTWLTLDNGYNREDAVRDIGALLDWIARQPDLDPASVAVMGGSYGGYMTLAALIRYGERLAAGIDLYGISDFVTFLEHTASYRADARRVEYGDERDPRMRKFLQSISPLTHAGRIRKPLLIIQGANDARVPLSESRQIVQAVRKNNRNVWFLVAGDEGHGYRKKSNRDYQEAVTALFLQRFLVEKKRH